MTYDFRKNDVIRFRRKLTSLQKDKIKDFAGDEDSKKLNRITLLLSRVNDKVTPYFNVVKTDITKKTKTEFLVVSDNYGMYRIQSRYLKVVARKTKHHLTSIFSSI